MNYTYLVFSITFLSSAVAVDAQTTAVTPVTLNGSPSRQIGQPLLIPKTANPNLVEGRELWSPTGIAFDTSTSPPMVYVADTLNNRVLAWKNSTGFSNGQPADLVIGQPDKYSTAASGPGTTFTTGLSYPTGLAVYKGDLYVADSGNNRVLRYPAPFTQYAQTGSYPTPDLYIGQPSLKSNKANYPSGSPTAQGLSFSSGGSSVYLAGIAFDSTGNMWVTDPGNRRVLEFRAADVASGGGLLTAAVELGQLDFVSLQSALSPYNSNSQLIANQFAVPSQLIFDAAGNLYVSDADQSIPASLSRVLVFAPAFTSGQSAARIMGVLGGTGVQNLTTTQLQAIANDTRFVNPGGIFLLADSSVGVVDTNDNRILVFPPYSSWPSASTYVSPQATGVLGQNGSFQTFGANGNTIPTVLTPPANAGVFRGPITAAFLPTSSELFVVDSGNNRVLVMPAQSGTVPFGNATRVLGQDTMTMNSPNLIEGREFEFYNGQSADAAIALDTSGSVPHLYVADPFNHRVLGFYDARKLQATGVPEGQQANNEIVIGEPDFNTALCNYPTGDPTKTTASGLCFPRGVLTDSNGNLYVADTSNGRVVRFPAPFANWPQKQVLESADLVLGQTSLTGAPITDPSAVHMAFPYGLAFTGTNGLMVSDLAYNRVLYIPFASGQTTFNAPADNGKSATKVFGQPDFVTVTAGSASNKLNAPHHIATDTNGQVYVTDTNNNRVQIFGDPNNPLTAPASAVPILSLPNLSVPQGIFVSPLTGEIWVTTGTTATRFPKYDTLQLNPASTGTVQAQATTLAVAQDQYGDLFLADATSRVAVYYQGLAGENGQATYQGQPLAPGVVASLYSVASPTQFKTGSMPSVAPFPALTGYPMPITLADEQVLFNGAPAPLYFVSPGQVNFLVPMSAPVSGAADVEIVQVSTGQVLGAASVAMNTVSPAIFCGAAGGCLLNGGFYQAAVINQDGNVNSSTNPAPRGSVISIFCTGQGALNNAPADGAAAPGPPNFATTPQTPHVAIGSCFVDDCGAVLGGDPTNGKWVEYSGLAPGFAGLWQINVHVPMATNPSNQVPIAIQYDGVGSANLSSGFHLTIAVK